MTPGKAMETLAVGEILFCAGLDRWAILLSMQIAVRFYSYFKELTGCAQTTQTVREGGTLGELHHQLAARFPKLADLRNSTLIAVGVDYQPRSYVLKEGDEVSLFPPVQGG